MLSRIDEIIYPNRCEVIEIEPSQRYIYPIFKNGSSSIIFYARDQKFKSFFNEQIKRLTTIDVVIRPSMPRFLSGVNSYIYDLKEKNSNLDHDTILYFVENYLFLNRHYSPQLGWLVHLSQYLNEDATIRLHDMSALSEFTPLNIKSYKHGEDSVLRPADTDRLTNNIHNQSYLRLDDLLSELIGKEMTFKEILTYIKKKDALAFSKLKCIALD